MRRGAGVALLAGLMVGQGAADASRVTIPKDSAERAKARDFDAQAEIRCAQEVGQAFGMCAAQVSRDAAGNAALVVRFPNGFARTLYFVAGAFTRGNATMSGVGTDSDWSVERGFYRIRIDDQRFEVPEALIRVE